MVLYLTTNERKNEGRINKERDKIGLKNSIEATFAHSE